MYGIFVDRSILAIHELSKRCDLKHISESMQYLHAGFCSRHGIGSPIRVTELGVLVHTLCLYYL